MKPQPPPSLLLGLEPVQSCLGVARVMSNYGYKKISVPVIFETLVYGRAGQASDENIAHAHSMLDDKGWRHKIRICNTYCLSTAAVVTRTRLNVTSTRSLYVMFVLIPPNHWLFLPECYASLRHLVSSSKCRLVRWSLCVLTRCVMCLSRFAVSCKWSI